MKKATWSKLDECPVEYQSFKNLDAGESIFFARELEHVKAQTYDIKYPNLKSRSLFPLDFATNAGAETITYEQYSQVGMAKIVANYADDLPRADVKGKEFTSNVRTIATSYGYNVDEVAAASKTGKPLVPRKAQAAKRAHAILENKIAFFGDSQNNLPGFFSNTNTTEVTLAADGTGASKTFASKSVDQILRDLNSLPTTVHSVSNGVETADTLLLPIEQFNYIATKKIDNSDMSVLKWFLSASPFIKNVEWVNECKGAGAGGSDRMAVYRKDPMALTMDIPSEFQQKPVQERNLEFVVPCHQRVAGVIIYYPLSIAWADGI